jgi:hypothetical protein
MNTAYRNLFFGFALLCISTFAQAQTCPGAYNFNGLCVGNPQGLTTLAGQKGTGAGGKGGSIQIAGGAPLAPSTATGDVTLFSDPLNPSVYFKCTQPTAGNTGTATCTFSDIVVSGAGGGGGVPGGSNTQVQYNNAGAFGGMSNVTWGSASGTLTIGAPFVTGLALDVTGVSGGGQGVAMFRSGYSTSIPDLVVTRAGSTVNTVADGPNITLEDVTNTKFSLMQQAGGQTEFWQYNGASWQQSYFIGTTLGLVLHGSTDKGVGVLSAVNVYLTPVATSALPTCNAGAAGLSAVVNDATVPTYNATLTGGGAVTVPVLCNGTNWTTH